MNVINVAPQGWVVARLGAIVDIRAGISFPPDLQGRGAGEIPFFKVGDISEGVKAEDVLLTKARNYVSVDDRQRLRSEPLPRDSVVFAKIGAALRLNRRGRLGTPAYVDNNVMAFVPTSAVDAGFLLHLSRTLDMGEYAQETAIPSIRKSEIAEIQVALPPLQEQRRIAAAIDACESLAVAGIASLATSRAKIAAYRAAVLRAACEGRLVPTEAELARAEGRAFEPAQEFLARHGAKVALTSGVDVPEGWAWAPLVSVAPPKLGLQDPAAFPRAIHLAPDNIESRTGRLLECRTVEEDRMTSPKHRFQKGDVVYSKIRPHLSKVVVAPFDGLCSADMYPLRPLANARFLQFVMLGEDFVRAAVARQGRSVLPKINLEGLAQISIPFPPPIEQSRIVAEVERRLSVVERLEAAIDANLARAKRLRQAILKRAFEGRLVPQDPNDEPASVLLERIRRERETAQRARPTQAKRKKAEVRR